MCSFFLMRIVKIDWFYYLHFPTNKQVSNPIRYSYEEYLIYYHNLISGRLLAQL